MNQNGLWILRIEAQFWRKIIVFQEWKNLNEECQIMDPAQSKEERKRNSKNEINQINMVQGTKRSSDGETI